MLEAGVDVLTVQTITGHRTLAMTKRYAHISNVQRQEALERVQRLHAAGLERSKR
jgi:site-specific recombinase XerD